MPTPSRRARYSGSERPAWRMNHTGVWGTGSPRTALRKALTPYSLTGAPACACIEKRRSHLL